MALTSLLAQGKDGVSRQKRRSAREPVRQVAMFRPEYQFYCCTTKYHTKLRLSLTTVLMLIDLSNFVYSIDNGSFMTVNGNEAISGSSPAVASRTEPSIQMIWCGLHRLDDLSSM